MNTSEARRKYHRGKKKRVIDYMTFHHSLTAELLKTGKYPIYAMSKIDIEGIVIYACVPEDYEDTILGSIVLDSSDFEKQASVVVSAIVPGPNSIPVKMLIPENKVLLIKSMGELDENAGYVAALKVRYVR